MKKVIGSFIGLILVLMVLTGCMTTDSRLHDAAVNGDLRSVQRYVERRANIDYRSSYTGSTPLINAAAHGHFDIVRYLVERGANINIRNSGGGTPLLNAAYNGHFEIVKYLVERGADINLRSNSGATALSHSYNRGNLQIYNYLLEQGAIEFEPIQSSQQTTPAPSQSTTTPSSPNTAQQIQEALRSPIDGGTYRLAGQNFSMSFTTVASSGLVTYTANGRTSMVSYSISGDTITFNFPSGIITGRVISRTSFVTNDGLWTRTGF